MRSMIAEGHGKSTGLILVGISAYPSPVGSPPSTPKFPQTMDVSFEGGQHSVSLVYKDFLLADLVQPTPAETVHFAVSAAKSRGGQ